MSHVVLGLLENAPAWSLTSKFLAHSKVGGKPAWLSYEGLPGPDSLTCQHCGVPMVFLVQLYAPFEDLPEGFHRHVFVFMCKDPKCHSPELSLPFVVFRNQLARSNKFYPSNPPQEVENYKPELCVGNFSSVCRACGCSGSMACAGCKKVTYCSKQHQREDWKHRHKVECQDSSFQRRVDSEEQETHPANLPQWEVVMQDDAESDESDSENEDGADDGLVDGELLKLEKLEAEEKSGSMDAVELEKYTSDSNPLKDPVFKKFLKITKKTPGQVIRYNRSGEPLWVSEYNALSLQDIPDCEHCKSPRTFEFQIMPQLLAHLKLDTVHSNGVDWGTIAVYTCSKSCSTINPVYKKEFLWRQFMPV